MVNRKGLDPSNMLYKQKVKHHETVSSLLIAQCVPASCSAVAPSHLVGTGVPEDHTQLPFLPLGWCSVAVCVHELIISK